MKQIIINSEELQVRVAVVDDGTLQDFFMERTNKDRIVGSIYKGRIKNLEPSLQAAFVDIGVGKNAFLHYWDMLPATQEMLEDGEDDDALIEENAANGSANSREAASPAPAAAAEAKTDAPAQESAPAPAPASIPGLLPLSKNAPAAPAAASSPIPGILPLTKETQAAAPPPIEVTYQQEEPPAQQQQFRHQGQRPPQVNQQQDGNANRGNNNNNSNGGRSRNRHRRRGGSNNSAAERQLAAGRPARPPKPGFFQRLCSILMPSTWFSPKPVELPPANAKGGHAGKNQLLPLTNKPGKQGGNGHLLPLSNGKGGNNNNAGQQQERSRNGGNQQSQPKSSAPKKPERKTPTVEDIPNLFKVDQEILVQVTKGPIGTKGARVTTNLSIPGRYLVLLPNCQHVGISRRVEDHEERNRLKQIIRTLELPPNMGLICRTVGAGVKREHFQRDLDMLLDAWKKGEETAANRKSPVCIYQEPALEERVLRDSLTQDIDEIICDSQNAYDRAHAILQRFGRQDSVKLKLYNNPTPVFIKYGLAAQIENISNRKVMLPSGGYLCIDETEALIAIDVNTGKNRSGKDQPETILETNMEAVKEIARQLRLRNIGGLVVLDLIDMRSRKDQMAVFRAFKQYTSEDHARIKIYPISGLGLLEMSRQRESESLESTMFETCPCCSGRGLVKTATSVSVEIQRRLHELMARKRDNGSFVLTVSQKVMDRIKLSDQKVLDDIAKKHHCALEVRLDNTMRTTEEYKITDVATGKEY